MCTRRFWGIACFCVLAYLSLFNSSLTQSCLAEEKYTMRFAHGFPSDNFIGIQYEEWATTIEQRSKGRLKIQIFPAAQLFNDSDLIRAIERGAVESGGTISFTLAPSVLEYSIFQLPFTFSSSYQLPKILKSEVGDILHRSAEMKGFKVVGSVALPVESLSLVSKKPIKVPSDCKGMIVRVIDPATQALVKLWGAGGSYLSGAEQYMALQRGTVDANFATIITSAERKLYEVATHNLIFPFAFPINPITINKAYFDKLPNEIQSIIVEVSEEITKKAPERALERYSWAMTFLKGKGFEPYIPKPEEMALWKEGVQPIRENLMKDVPRGLELLKKLQTVLGQ